MWDKPINVREHKTLGYLYFMDKAHPLADKYGFVYHHRHIASLKLGRWLTVDELVHHIDEDRTNNVPNNLKISDRSAHGKTHKPEVTERECLYCNTVFTPNCNGIRFCSTGCASSKSRRFEIDPTPLFELVWSMPTTEVAKLFKVSDTAVAKRCCKLGIIKPGGGYWQKQQATLV